MSLHPTPGKKGVRISKEKYDAIRFEILQIIKAKGSISFVQLMKEAAANLEGKFDGSVPWYVTTVKLDLEARGVLERVAGKSAQQLRLCAEE